MLARLRELFVVDGPLDAALAGGLGGFVAASLVVLLNLGRNLVESAIAFVFLYLLAFALITIARNAYREAT